MQIPSITFLSQHQCALCATLMEVEFYNMANIAFATDLNRGTNPKFHFFRNFLEVVNV
jgi:hypothetical protein